MKNRVRYRAPLLEMLDDNPLQKLRCHFRVPDPVRIDHHDRTIAANAQAWRLAALHASRTEEQIFALQQLRQQRIDLASTTFRRAETARADQDVPGVRLHHRRSQRTHRAKIYGVRRSHLYARTPRLIMLQILLFTRAESWGRQSRALRAPSILSSPARVTYIRKCWSALPGLPSISTMRISESSRATKTCCCTTPGTFPARRR